MPTFAQRGVEQVKRAAVEVGGTDNVVSCAGDVQDGQRNRCLARTPPPNATDAPLQPRQFSVSNTSLRRIHDAGVDVARVSFRSE